MLKSYKYRLYPTGDQKILLEKHFGCTRFIWNWALNKKLETYQKDKTNISRFELQALIPEMKKNGYEWLTEVGSLSLQSKLEDLDKAFTSFFKYKTKYPNFKSKKNRQCFRIPQSTKVNFTHKKVIIPKFLEGIKCIFDREFIGKISSSFVSKTTTNKYFISILVDDNTNIPVKPKINENKTIGIDLGLRHFATLSNNEKIENPKFLKKKLKKLRRKQRQLSRKKKGSNNRNKHRILVAKIHEKITNSRDDFHHKLTYKLTHDNQVNTICIENLSVKSMMGNKYMGRQIADVGWTSFVNLLRYKCEWYGKNLVQIGRFEPSSKLCSCGYLNKELKLSDKSWKCVECGTEHDRDILAANNIKKLGLGQPEVKPVDISIRKWKKQETLSFREG